MRTFFTFYGGKWRAAPRYPAPDHETVIEPFAGSAGYSIRHHRRKVILVERDPVIAATWRYLLRVSESEILGLPDLLPGETVHDLELCEEATHLVGWWLNKGAEGPRRKPSAWMRGGTRPNSFWGEAIRNRIASQLQGIRHWQLIEGDYSSAPDIEATWFIDPPYEAAGKHYRFGSDLLDYAGLSDWCRSRCGQAMVCENVGAGWLPFTPFLEIKANGTSGRSKTSKEALWQSTRSVEEKTNGCVHRV